jgi:hypothetical protein
MRVNVYAEEIRVVPEPAVEIVRKEVDGQVFYGIRLYLGFPFIHREGDDDSSAVTFWVPWTKEGGQDFTRLRNTFMAMITALHAAWNEEIRREEVTT